MKALKIIIATGLMLFAASSIANSLPEIGKWQLDIKKAHLEK